MPRCTFCEKTVALGTESCPHCGAPLEGVDPQAVEDLQRQVRSLLEQGRKLDAVRLYKERATVSLLEAKNAVEALEQGRGLPPSAAVDTDVEADILNLLERNEKLKAVKLYKQRTGSTLKEAKGAVEALAAKHSMAVSQGAGCAGIGVLLLVLVLAAIVVLIVLMAFVS